MVGVRVRAVFAPSIAPAAGIKIQGRLRGIWPGLGLPVRWARSIHKCGVSIRAHQPLTTPVSRVVLLSMAAQVQRATIGDFPADPLAEE